MDNKRFYVVKMLVHGASLTRHVVEVLFYADDVEYWGEPPGQAALKRAFLANYYDQTADIIEIVPVALDYIDCVVAEKKATDEST